MVVYCFSSSRTMQSASPTPSQYPSYKDLADLPAVSRCSLAFAFSSLSLTLCFSVILIYELHVNSASVQFCRVVLRLGQRCVWKTTPNCSSVLTSQNSSGQSLRGRRNVLLTLTLAVDGVTVTSSFSVNLYVDAFLKGLLHLFRTFYLSFCCLILEKWSNIPMTKNSRNVENSKKLVKNVKTHRKICKEIRKAPRGSRGSRKATAPSSVALY